MCVRQLNTNTILPGNLSSWNCSNLLIRVSATHQLRNEGTRSSALQAAGILEKYKDVIEGFLGGFDQGIPHYTVGNKAYFKPKNHTSSLIVVDKIKANIENEVNKRQMFGPLSHLEMLNVFSVYRSSPLGVVVNRDSSVRPINDLLYPRNVPNTPSVNLFLDRCLQDYLG